MTILFPRCLVTSMRTSSPTTVFSGPKLYSNKGSKQTYREIPRFMSSSVVDLDPAFQLVSDPYQDPDPVLDPTWIISNILIINFTGVLLSCKCVRFFYWIFFIIRNLYFLIEKLSNFIRFLEVVLLKIHFESGAIRILLKVSDPTGSRSTTLMSSAYCTEHIFTYI